MTPQIATNLMAFMERVPLTGKEAAAWCESYAALQALATPAQPSSSCPPDPALPVVS